MTLEQLRVLQKIVELGSLKAAATALFKTQPALSMAIKKLEQQYNIELLDREQYRLTLTPQGKIFYRQAQQLLQNAVQLDSIGHQLSKGNESLFKIGFDPVCDTTTIIDSVKEAKEKFPVTEFQLISGSRLSALEQIDTGKVDVAIGAWFHLFHGLGDYFTQPIAEFELVLASSPELLPDPAPTTLAQLTQLPSVTLLESNLAFDTERLGIHNSSQQFKTNDITTLKEMLCSGLGVAIIPKAQISEELSNGSLVAIALHDFEASLIGEVRLIRRTDKVLGPVGQYIWDTMASKAIKKND